jgi:peroxiredoxin
VGDRAPDFSLPDEDRATVTLSSLLASPFSTQGGEQRRVNGVVLIFYRGYW